MYTYEDKGKKINTKKQLPVPVYKWLGLLRRRSASPVAKISIMWRFSAILSVAVLVAANPVEKLPVLQPLPAEVLFKIPSTGDFVLNCATVDKDQGVKYSWIKDGQPLKLRSDITPVPNEGTLIFKKPTLADEGQYQCQAQTNLGVASSRTVTVRHTYLETPQVAVEKHRPVDGKVYKLDCVIPKAYPRPEITWTVQSGSETKPVAGARFTVSDQGTLYLASVEKEDAKNKFVCSAQNGAVDHPVVVAEHVVEDVVADKGPKNNDVVEQYVSKDVTAKLGDSLFLYCIYGGTPLAHPDWLKGGKDINNSAKDRVTRYNKSVGKRLIIKEVLASDVGDYVCNVDNEVGKPQKSTIHLNVVSAPRFIKHGEPKLIVKAGDDVTIPCEVEAIPTAKVSWSHNTKVLHSEPVLTLKSVKKSDSGYYGCRAVNEYGENYVETLVYVQ